jgi:hypothetical protein
MKANLTFLGVYRTGQHRASDPPPTLVLRLSTPSGQTRDVEVTRRDLLRMIQQAAELLEKETDK